MALGYEHPDFLIPQLTAKQVTEWEAFNRIQPIGARRYDYYFGYLMTAIHNIAIGFSGNKNAQPCKFEEFVPKWGGIEEEPVAMAEDEIKKFFMNFAEEHNKHVKKNQENDKRPPR